MVKKIRNASGTEIWNSQYLSLPWGTWVQILRSVLDKGNKPPSAEAWLGMSWACSEVQQGGSMAWMELVKEPRGNREVRLGRDLQTTERIWLQLQLRSDIRKFWAWVTWSVLGVNSLTLAAMLRKNYESRWWRQAWKKSVRRVLQ